MGAVAPCRTCVPPYGLYRQDEKHDIKKAVENRDTLGQTSPNDEGLTNGAIFLPICHFGGRKKCVQRWNGRQRFV